MSGIDFERRLEEALAGYADRPMDAGAAWRRLAERRRQAAVGRARRLVMVTAAGAVAVAAVMVPYVLRPGGGDPGSKPAGSQHGLAITARIEIPGPGHGPGDEHMAEEVIDQHGQVWVMTYDHYLTRVDPRSNEVMLRKHVTGLLWLAAGAGALWALVAGDGHGGHLVKLDPVNLQVLARFKVPRMCRDVSFGGGQLWVECGGERARFLRIDPSTGHVLARSGLASNASNLVATADGIWYSVGTRGVSGYVETGSRLTWVRAGDAADMAFTDSLAYANGWVWAFVNGEDVARISPVTGRITKVYHSTRYDQHGDLSLTFFAVDRNSIWFLRLEARQGTAVLRVSLATGRPIGRISGVGSCGEPCWQVYLAQGSAWVPTRTQLVRISPGRAEG
jgi:glutamine cyclotransferase